jgi:hypothetical protein
MIWDIITEVTFRIAFLIISPLLSVGCVYRLQPHIAMTPLQLQLLTATPQTYTVHVEGTRPQDHAVPLDGRLRFDPPTGLSRACSVYLFNVIRISDGAASTKAKVIDVTAGNKTVRRLSIREFFALPSDADGFHQLRIDH